MRRGAWLAVVAIVAGFAVPVGPAHAATSAGERQEEIADEVRRLRAELGELDDQEAEVLAELRVSQRRRAQLDAAVAALDVDVAAAEAELAVLSAEVEAAMAAEQAAERDLRIAQDRLAEAKALLQEQAVQAYIHFGTAPPLEDMVFQVDDINEAPRLAAYVEAVTDRQAEVVEQHRELEAETAELEREKERIKDEVAARRDDLVARKDALHAARAEQATARAAVLAEEGREQAALQQVEAVRAQHEQRILELQRESDTIENELRRRQSGQTVTPGGSGVISWPLANPVVSSSFGYRTHPIYGDRRLHAGIDLRGGTGTPILAARQGEVVYAGWRTGYGNTVIIDHGGSLATLYAHQSAIAVQVGQTVSRGEVIGRVGATGNVTGAHLHFEVRLSGTPVDPMNYL